MKRLLTAAAAMLLFVAVTGCNRQEKEKSGSTDTIQSGASVAATNSTGGAGPSLTDTVNTSTSGTDATRPGGAASSTDNASGSGSAGTSGSLPGGRSTTAAGPATGTARTST